MARFDQYIGLNKKAVDFIEFLKQNYEVETSEFILVPQGQTLCGQNISGDTITV
mgnify:CR=1 FL=1